jgi:hypothetical protein
MSHRLPGEAFQHYLSLGAQRSYQAVADHFGVSKQAVTARATRERWQQRLAEIEAKARESGERRAIETLEELNERSLKMWMAVEKRALEALRTFQMSSAMDAVRSLDIAGKNIRLIRGEPTERTENLETIVRREYERWMRPVEDVRERADPDHSASGEENGVGDGAAAV